MTTVFHDEDADLATLAGETIAVVGYGNQGRSQALNLRDSGLSVVVGNIDEVETATATRDPRAGAAALLELGATIAIVKRGGDGVYARTAREEITVPAIEMPVLNGLGAGDAFGGALCHGLLAGWSLRRTLEAANAAGAIVASRLACADAMPTLAEIETVLARRVSA